MPLSEANRQKLDGIVSQMEANGEPAGNIQAVVNDFKAKYESAGLNASAFRRSDEIPDSTPDPGEPGGPDARASSMLVPLSVAGGLGPSGSLTALAKEALAGGVGTLTGMGIGAGTDYLGLTGGYGKPVFGALGGIAGVAKPDRLADLIENLPLAGRTAIPKMFASKVRRSMTVEELEEAARARMMADPQLSQAVPESSPNISMNVGDAPMASSATRELAEKLVAQGAAKSVDEAADYVSRATPQQLNMLEEVAARPVGNYVERVPAQRNPLLDQQIDEAVEAARGRMTPKAEPVDPVATKRLADRRAKGEANVAASQSLTREPPVIENLAEPFPNDVARAAARRRVAEEALQEKQTKAAAAASDVTPTESIETKAARAVTAKKTVGKKMPKAVEEEEILQRLSMLYKTDGVSKDAVLAAVKEAFPDTWASIMKEIKKGNTRF